MLSLLRPRTPWGFARSCFFPMRLPAMAAILSTSWLHEAVDPLDAVLDVAVRARLLPVLGVGRVRVLLTQRRDVGLVLEIPR